ncbi:hypothetical protein ACFL6N_07505 [Thermodesulfobacteriota bacterium]
MAELTPMTELEAVNAMLTMIGEQPVISIPGSGISEAALAANKLHTVSRRIQKKGLHCNTEERYPLIPDISGFMQYPTNVLQMDASNSGVDVVRRGTKFYDRYNHTFVFTVNELLVDVTWFLDFEDLPEYVREYIGIEAALEFQKEVFGSETINRLHQDRLTEAKAEFIRHEARTDDRTMLHAPGVYDVVNRIV